MKRFLFLALLLPMLLVGCELNKPIDEPQCAPHQPVPALWRVYTAYNGASYRAPKLSAGFSYEHTVGYEKKWEKLFLEFWSSQEVFPEASGMDDVIWHRETPYPESSTKIISKGDSEYDELYKEFATTAQLFHLGSQLSQLTDDGETNRYTHAEVVDMTITADVPLYGREAGNSLVDKFGVRCFYELVDFATYDVIEAGMKVLTLGSLQRTLLQEEYTLKPVEMPEEQYDKVTFTVAMDIRRPDGKLVALTNSVTVEFEN